MRARIFNLIDATFPDPIQRESFRGLIRDFTAEAHYAFNRELIDFLSVRCGEGQMHQGVSKLVDEPRSAVGMIS